MNEDILRSSLSSTFEDLQLGEDNNLETNARDDYGIAFQEECFECFELGLRVGERMPLANRK